MRCTKLGFLHLSRMLRAKPMEYPLRPGFVRLPKQEAGQKMSPTASVQTERTPWGEVEFEERKEAELFQFSRVGETIQGVLVKMEPVEIKDKKNGSPNKTIAY